MHPHVANLFSIVLLAAQISLAQANKPGKPAAKPLRQPSAAQPVDEAADNRKALVAQARAELDAVVDDLKQIEKLSTALPLVRTLVKQLAPHRPERCRELLEKLFDTAEQQAVRDEAKLKNGGAYQFQTNFKTIINIAASFDAEFSRKLLDRFHENPKLTPVMDKAESGYSLAKELLNTNPQQAVAVAHKLTGEAFTFRALEFIGQLRHRDPKLAQSYLDVLLRQLETRRYPALEELFALYPYVFLVAKFPSFVPERGQLAFRQNVDYGKHLAGLTVDAALAKRYLQLGLKLLLEQERYLAGQVWEKADPRGDLVLLDLILLPGAKQYLPEALEPLSQRRGALLGFLDPAAQEGVQRSVSAFAEAKQNLPNPGDPLQQAAETQDPERKDQLYYLAAGRAVKEKDYAGALALADKMSIRNSRTAHEFIAYEIAVLEIKDGKLDDARRRLADDSDLTRRAYGLSQLALAYLDDRNRDLPRVTEALNEVASLASKLDPGVEKALVRAGLAAVYARYDSVRALEAFREFVAAANQSEQFDGSNFLTRFLKLNNFYYTCLLYQNKLIATEVYTQLAHQYFNALLQEARSLSHPQAKATAVITLCQTVLGATS